MSQSAGTFLCHNKPWPKKNLIQGHSLSGITSHNNRAVATFDAAMPAAAVEMFPKFYIRHRHHTFHQTIGF